MTMLDTTVAIAAPIYEKKLINIKFSSTLTAAPIDIDKNNSSFLTNLN